MKRRSWCGAVLSLAVGTGALAAVCCYAALDLEDLQGAWLFNEGDGEEVSDSSGNEHDGEFFGEPEWVGGKYGSALEFDGAADWVEIGQGERVSIASDRTHRSTSQPPPTSDT